MDSTHLRQRRVAPEDDELELVRRLRAGEDGASRLLLDAYWYPLVAYASQLLRDLDVAEDVVQECLAQLLLRRDRLAITTSLRAYLYRTVHNRAIDHRRKSRRRLRLWRDHLRRLPPEDRVGPPVEPGELSATLSRALASLPKRRRQAFVLAHLHDLSYKEVGEILEISPQTVANQISRALATLRARLRAHAATILDVDPLRDP